jgi:adenine-specific DNA-methyltransferase
MRFLTFGIILMGTKLYDRLLQLYDVVHVGTGARNNFGFKIDGFKETVFTRDELAFAQKYSLRNEDLVKVLFVLGYTESDSPDRKYQQVPYNFFTARQLGSIYESFLEYILLESPTDQIYNKKTKRWAKADLRKREIVELECPKVEKGQLYFAFDSDNRKGSGTYYTPDPIVRYIVDGTLNPILDSLTPEQITKVTVCDPSMGSGHFLSVAIERLTNAYRAAICEEELSEPDEAFSVSAQRILKSCIFGVDINPRAVKLAKMSLWLSTAYSGRTLEHLDDKLKTGDSLHISEKFDFSKSFPEVFRQGGFDAVIGNPPWVSFGLRDVGKLTPEIKDKIRELYPDSAEYKISVYAIFMDLFQRITKEKGRNGIIVPDSFLLGMYFSKIRALLLKETTLDHITLIKADFWGSACSGFNVMYFLTKARPAKDSSLWVTFNNGLEALLNGESSTREVSNKFSSNTRSRFRLFFENEIESFVKKMEDKAHPLSYYGTVRTGVRSKIGQKNIISSKKEKTTFQKGITSGSNVVNFSVDWTGEYINIDPKLLNAGGWDPSVIKSTKLLVRQTADNLIAGVDRGSLYHLNNCHSFVADKNDIPVEYVAAVLNSNAMRSYYRYISLESGRAMAQVDIDVLEEVPIKLPSDPKDLAKVVELVKKVEGKSPDDKRARGYIAEIDSLILRIYGLSSVANWVLNSKHFCPKLPKPALAKAA